MILNLSDLASLGFPSVTQESSHVVPQARRAAQKVYRPAVEQGAAFNDYGAVGQMMQQLKKENALLRRKVMELAQQLQQMQQQPSAAPRPASKQVVDVTPKASSQVQGLSAEDAAFYGEESDGYGDLDADLGLD